MSQARDVGFGSKSGTFSDQISVRFTESRICPNWGQSDSLWSQTKPGIPGVTDVPLWGEEVCLCCVTVSLFGNGRETDPSF